MHTGKGRCLINRVHCLSAKIVVEALGPKVEVKMLALTEKDTTFGIVNAELELSEETMRGLRGCLAAIENDFARHIFEGELAGESEERALSRDVDGGLI